MPERTSTADVAQDGNSSVGCRRGGERCQKILPNAVKQQSHTETFQAQDVTSLGPSGAEQIDCCFTFPAVCMAIKNMN